MILKVYQPTLAYMQPLVAFINHYNIFTLSNNIFDNEQRINTYETSKPCYNKIMEVFYENLSFRQRY